MAVRVMFMFSFALFAIFSNGESNKVGEIKYFGCYQDQPEHRLLADFSDAYPNDNSPTYCLNLCFQKGYPYSGVGNGVYCSCGFYHPPVIGRIAQSVCNMPCPADPNETCGSVMKVQIYQTGIYDVANQPNFYYLGCYGNEVASEIFAEHTQQLTNLSPQHCQNICYKKGYMYFALSKGRECSCGDQKPYFEYMVGESQCAIPCSGKMHKRCGGQGGKMSVFATGITDYPANGVYVGCFKTPSEAKLLKSTSVELKTLNSPRRCMNICLQKGYDFSGVENGIECRCGNDPPTPSSREADGFCGLPCPADQSETCGHFSYIKIYRTYDPEEGIPPAMPTNSYKPAAEPPTVLVFPPHKPTPPDCSSSSSLVQGHNMCKHQLLFAETFDTWNTSVWKHAVQIASKPDFEFVHYSDSPDNSYIENGKLVIKPTFLDNDFIKRGTLDLNKNCTGVLDTEECVKRAVSYNILPPVISARISTIDSFYFRYGTVTVEAKLPLGDWIVPEIWLLPKEEVYGKNYASGKIVIALSRGNRRLTCDGEELGNDRLEMGVYYGSGTEEITRKVMRKDLPEGWANDFHKYTIMWSPDKIQAKVDDEAPQTVVDDTKYYGKSALRRPKKSSTVLAPFDQDFYVSLGLSVGGIREFPDNCVNENDDPKPWMNNAVKSLLTFWKDMSKWRSTWQDPTLEIKEIRIVAN